MNKEKLHSSLLDFLLWSAVAGGFSMIWWVSIWLVTGGF